MQHFEPLFRRAWERSRDLKLRGYIFLSWLLLISFAIGIAAAAAGAYYVLIEKKRAEQSIVEVNPELRRIFAPKRTLKFKDEELSFGTRRGDKLGKVVIRTPKEEIRAKSADLHLSPDKNTVNLTLRDYRTFAVTDGAIADEPTSEDEWGTLDKSYTFEMPPGLISPRQPVPGEVARGLMVVALIALSGVAVWCWVWQMFSAGIAGESFAERPTRIWRGFGRGFARWRTVMYPLPFVTVCSVVSLIGSLPNILQLPLAFYLAVYPLACAVEITLLVFCGIMKVGVALNPPDARFGDIFRESIRVFLNGWGRYLFGVFWVYAFAALFAVLLMPALVLMLDAVLFGYRTALVVGIVWFLVWLVPFLAIGLRVLGCIAAYQMYLYVDAMTEEEAPDGGAKAPEGENTGGDGI